MTRRSPRGARTRFLSIEAEGLQDGTATDAYLYLAFRRTVLGLHEQGLVGVPEGSLPVLVPDTEIGLTAAGWNWIDAHC